MTEKRTLEQVCEGTKNDVERGAKTARVAIKLCLSVNLDPRFEQSTGHEICTDI